MLTTDFFTPVVDDPYDYGAIAAANSLSDVYAMGGSPSWRSTWPPCRPTCRPRSRREIIRGGAEKAREAGVVIAGGHTIQDKEPKYGLVVVGFVDPRRMLTKGGAAARRPAGADQAARLWGDDHRAQARPGRPGRRAGSGGLDDAPEPHRRPAGALSSTCAAATDVTGFSLLGHGWEMARASGVGLRLQYAAIPFMSCARKYAEAWDLPRRRRR